MRTLALFLLLALPWSAPACPMCREAVTQTSDAEAKDQFREAQAYNRSIYLMLAVPYLALGVVGFCIYRGLRQGNGSEPVETNEAQG